MAEILSTKEEKVPQAENKPPASAISLLNLALRKLEQERNGEILDEDTIEERNSLWATSISDISSLKLREFLYNTYKGIFFFVNHPVIIAEYYEELGEDFSLFFQTYITGYCKDLIGKAKPGGSITSLHIGDGTEGSGEYSDKVINFINAIGPALEDIGIMRGDNIGDNIMTDLKTSFDQEYTRVIEAYNRPIDTN
ncbi:hypothetical protein A3D78_02445 [Candidatus Gottesmanbacteria bacterium RIFCSPHIGHO2_02_FULL_39_14]|uniref:Uncharacterized protein n=1 Tax=Candidatus Gottesmanbacteria bacterium RIFCSPHIGHO2_02_FULL_39_14 TaxID=1798383 RepID=A0A1F5ZYL3_9BACT|nr:MAG: hypothetical protein A3D78_02445 [Candidatus Gottesmanbacteria bacterium RIFCSPHIGHO2_02_FULL_39_14]